MLTQYLSDTRNLLNDQGAQFYTDSELTNYLNRARNYIATLGECLRDVGTVSVTSSYFTFAFSAVAPVSLTTGSHLFSPRQMWVRDGSMIEMRTYEWFVAYVRPAILSASSTLQVAAIQNQGFGSTVFGNVVMLNGPAVALPYTLAIDGIWLPIPLVNDATREDIPALWTECCCYYAAHLALIRAQRHQDAAEMLQQFNEKLAWARQAGTSSYLPTSTESVGGPGTQAAAGYGTLSQSREG